MPRGPKTCPSPVPMLARVVMKLHEAAAEPDQNISAVESARARASVARWYRARRAALVFLLAGCDGDACFLIGVLLVPLGGRVRVGARVRAGARDESSASLKKEGRAPRLSGRLCTAEYFSTAGRLPRALRRRAGKDTAARGRCQCLWR